MGRQLTDEERMLVDRYANWLPGDTAGYIENRDTPSYGAGWEALLACEARVELLVDLHRAGLLVEPTDKDDNREH